MRDGRILRYLASLVLICTALLCCAGTEEAPLTVSLPETVKGYTPCVIRIVSPADGEAELRLYDAKNNPWRTIHAGISAGENRIPWDGLGENLERLFAGPYHWDVTLAGSDGKERKGSGRFNISGTTPTLVYALPSSETLYLDGSEKWFVECYVSVECGIEMQVLKDGRKVWTREDFITAEDGETLFWDGTAGKKGKLEPGDYTLVFCSKKNPDYSFTCPLHIAESGSGTPEIAVTGPVIPERGMTDAEIWEIMMKPSVVISGKSIYTRYDLYEKPGTRSRKIASLRCGTQGLEVLGFEGEWAQVRAWSHSDGKPYTGYIRTEMLTVYAPGPHYGLLVDKRDQTMTVYRDGVPLGTLPVSTGLVSGGNYYRETPAGAFLTNVRMGASFAQEGYRYEYPIRYDAGNIIHSVGYVRIGRVRDYSDNLPLLGRKASHGCVRVSPFADEENPINMYWLWTRLPYHTRVIILDD